MPNSPSAKKRLRQSETHRARNRVAKTLLRTKIRTVRETAESANLASLDGDLKAATQRLDKTAAQKVIHKNKAARLKSRLNRLAKKAKLQVK